MAKASKKLDPAIAAKVKVRIVKVQPYILIYRHDGRPQPLTLVGPFTSYDASVRWAKKTAHNPADNPCWHTIEIEVPSLQIMTPASAAAAFLDGSMI